MTITHASRKEEGGETRNRISGRMPLSERIMKKVVTAAIFVGLATAPVGCTLQTSGLNNTDASHVDSGPDADVDADVDSGPDADVDADVDSGPDADVDGGLDSGPDADVDADVEDGGPDADVDGGLDSGPDADVDADVDADAGPFCVGVFNQSVFYQNAYVGTPISVGGYSIENTGLVAGGIQVDITCGSSSDPISTGLFLPTGGPEVPVDVLLDGKRIRLTNQVDGASLAKLDVIVETL